MDSLVIRYQGFPGCVLVTLVLVSLTTYIYFRKPSREVVARENDSRIMIVGLRTALSLMRGTRHNLGEMVIKELSTQLGITADMWIEYAALYASIAETERYILVLPNTLINNSGKAVLRCLDAFNIPASQMCIVYDGCVLLQY